MGGRVGKEEEIKADLGIWRGSGERRGRGGGKWN